MTRYIVAALALVFLVTAGLVISVPAGLWNFSYGQLLSRYQRPDSKFVDLDGYRVHYEDQGSGPVIVLLHGNLGNLRMWDAWVADLQRDYRVIRLDFPAHGLTRRIPGQSQFPGESIHRGEHLLEALLDRLGVQRFAVVGTSFAGIISYRFAAQHPNHVAALVLISSGGLPRTAKTDPNRPHGNALLRWLHSYYFPYGYVKLLLRQLVGPGFMVTKSLTDEYYYLNNMRGRRQLAAAGTRDYRLGDFAGFLAAVQAPVLILWGDSDPLLPTSEVGRFKKALRSTQVESHIYSGIGHLLPIEAATAGVADLRSFLAVHDFEPDEQSRIAVKVHHEIQSSPSPRGRRPIGGAPTNPEGDSAAERGAV